MPPISSSGFHENREENTSDILFLKQGVTHLRVLPAYNEQGNWFRAIKEIPMFVDGKYSPIVSPATVGKPCPFTAEGRRLYEEGGEDNVELAKKFRPRNSYLFNVVVKTTPDGEADISNCVKVLKCGIQVQRQILSIDQDAAGGWGDITNLTEGFDIRINREGSGRIDTKYTVLPVPNKGSILEWLESKNYPHDLTPHDLGTYYSPVSDEEIKEAFENFNKELTVNESAPEREEDEENLKPPVAPMTSSTPEPVAPLNREV